STPEALALAASRRGHDAQELMVVMPAGPGGAYVTRVRIEDDEERAATVEPSRLVTSLDAVAELVAGTGAVALDLPDAAVTTDALELGRGALAGLGGALLAIGSTRLKRRRVDDVAELVPAYVTLPRGVPEVVGGVGWSHELR
ncbi:MAG: hypothetical protein M3301_09730, partial [Chloroflexota bacterium]|nr:hypothetical protein [Chloroflexota bacterium]